MSQDIIARSNVRWNLQRPAIVVCDQFTCTPYTSGRACFYQADSIDLVEQQFRLVNILAIAITVGQVGYDGTEVTYRPVCPLQLYRTTCFDGCSCLSRCGAQMANDIWGVIVVDVSIVDILRVGP